MTPSEEKIARYTRVEREADDLGRVIGVRNLRLSQVLKVEEMTPGLDGSVASVGEDGEIVSNSKRALPFMAAMVCEIDGVSIPFPRNRGELDAVLDRLDTEGLAAAGKAMKKLTPPTDEGGETSTEAAKK